jgi:hypothetical protein
MCNADVSLNDSLIINLITYTYSMVYALTDTQTAVSPNFGKWVRSLCEPELYD